MSASVQLRIGWLLLAFSAAPLLPGATHAETPSAATSVIPRDLLQAISGDPTGTLQRALDYERRRNWSAAIQVYRDAKVKWPSKGEFISRLRLCEMHQRLVRRYQDQSFRNVLIKLPRDKAFDLLDELFERIEGHYVDAVTLEPLIRRGYDNLEVALRDPKSAFLAANAPNAAPDRLAWLREQLQSRRLKLVVVDRDKAREEVAAAAALGRSALNLADSPVIMEFIFGSCDMLDEYTSYLTPDKLDDMFAMIDGNFVGLGVELKQDVEGLKLVGVIRGGPAFDAGIRAGDRIVAIGGQPVKGLGLDDAAGRLQGAEGTSVDVSVLRADSSRKSFRLVRRHVEVESVTEAKILETTSGVGYIQLGGFQRSSAEELDKAIVKLKKQGMRYLVLDLRGNPGGLLTVAVEIADRFVDQGVIVSTRGRAPGQTQVYRAKPDKPYTMELAILVDHDSASASEILAGALQELDRAVVIGDRSYGKGSVQSIFELRSAPAGLKLTTAKFYSPKNRAYSEQGVTPDIPVAVRARPVFDDEEDAEIKQFGDPATDPVLDIALQQARRKMTKR